MTDDEMNDFCLAHQDPVFRVLSRRLDMLIHTTSALLDRMAAVEAGLKALQPTGLALDQHRHDPIVAQAYAGSEWCSVKNTGTGVG